MSKSVAQASIMAAWLVSLVPSANERGRLRMAVSVKQLGQMMFQEILSYLIEADRNCWG